MFERVDAFFLHPADHAVDAAQAGEGLEEKPPLADGQVGGFHQGKPQQARLVGVFEIRGMAESRREEHDVCLFPTAQRKRLQGRALEIEKAPEAGNVQLIEGLGKQLGDHISVFQHLPEAAGVASMVCQHRPGTGRSPDEVATGGHQKPPAGRLDAAHVVKESRARMDQIRRDQALPHQVLRPVNIGQHGIEQADPLIEPGGNFCPLGRWDHQRDGIEFEGLAYTADVAEDIEGRAQIFDHPGGRRRERGFFIAGPAMNAVGEALPVVAVQPGRVRHFIPRHSRHSGAQRRRGNAGALTFSHAVGMSVDSLKGLMGSSSSPA